MSRIYGGGGGEKTEIINKERRKGFQVLIHINSNHNLYAYAVRRLRLHI